jgi:carboxyl-terminal processing protease
VSKAPGGAFTVSSVVADSPAADAGIKSGDLIDEIGGRPSQSLSRADVLALFQQPAGTTVDLRVREPARSLSVRLRDVLR